MSVTAIEPSLRRAVIELHGTLCLRCGVQCTPDWWGPTALHVDHVIPEAHGGPTTLANLQVLCRTCNLAKGATYADYRRVRPAKPQSETGLPWIGVWWSFCFLMFVLLFGPACMLGGLVGVGILLLVVLGLAASALILWLVLT